MTFVDSHTPENDRSSHDSGHCNGSLTLDRQVALVGRIKRRTGTHDKAVFDRINSAITGLRKAGNVKALRGVRDGRIHPMELIQPGVEGKWDEPIRETIRVEVYAMVAQPSGNIKLGITTGIARRLLGLRSAHWEELSLLCSVPATPSDESLLHQALAPHCIRGEWYRPAEPVLRAIEFMKSHNKVPLLLGELQKVGA